MIEFDSSDDLVVVYDAPDQTTAEVICATLRASGIPAALQHEYRSPAAGMLTYLGTTEARGVVVTSANADAARAVLAEQEPSEEELTAEVDADEMTLEEAEARVK